MGNIAFVYLLIALVIVFFRCTRKHFIKLKTFVFGERMEKILVLLVSAVSILGVSISTAWPFINDNVPIIYNYIWERKVEQISVLSSREFVESIAGTPLTCEKIEYPLLHSKDTEVGSKAIYASKACVLIVYYRDDDSIEGYVVIRLNKGFSPKILGGGSASWEKSFGENKEIILTEKSFVGCQRSGRADNSIFYAEAYSHHLSTNNTLIGLAYAPQIGICNKENDDIMRSADCEGIVVIQKSGETVDGFNSNLKRRGLLELRRMKPNAFFRFRDVLVDSGIDISRFIQEIWQNEFFISSGEWRDIKGYYYIFD